MSSRYRRIKVVGRGSFGCCWLVERVDGKNGCKEPELCILKQIDVSRMPTRQKDEAANEVKVLSQLRHPFIINYRESYVEDGLLCILTDYAERGDLYDAIRCQKRLDQLFPESLVLKWIAMIVLALKHMHDRRILHRDLKTQNVFLTGSGDGIIKVGDFGIARVLEHTQDFARTAIGTPYYLSPEICQEKPYDFKSDVWSLGCVLFELATLEHAFDADSMRGLVMKILRGVPPQVPLVFSAELRSLVPELLTKDPRRRPSVAEVLKRPIMRATIRQLLRDLESGRAGPKQHRSSLESRQASVAGGKVSQQAVVSQRRPSVDNTPIPNRAATPSNGASRRAEQPPSGPPELRQEQRQSREQDKENALSPILLPSPQRPESPSGHKQRQQRGNSADRQRQDRDRFVFGHALAAAPLRRLSDERQLRRQQEPKNTQNSFSHQPRPSSVASRTERPHAVNGQPVRGHRASAGCVESSNDKNVDGKRAAESKLDAAEAKVDRRRESPMPPQPQPRDEDHCGLLATLEEGLRLPEAADAPTGDTPPKHSGGPQSPGAEQPPPKVTPVAPRFLQPDGRTLRLPVCDRDSLSYRIEALKVYLEQELGVDDFICVYRYLNDESTCGAQARMHGEAPAAQKQRPLDIQVSAKAIDFLPLVHQLIVCEDECYVGT